METPAWILVIILSITLAIFLIVGIVLLVKLIGLTKDVRSVVATGQKIADNVEDATDNIVDATDNIVGAAANVKNMTTISGIVASVTDAYNQFKKGKKRGKK